MTSALLYRAVIGDLTETEKKTHFREITGKAVPYWEWTVFGDRLERFIPGALDASTIKSSRSTPLLLFHDARQFPIGRSVRWESRSDGLYGTWRLNKSPDAQYVAELAEAGYLNHLSVGIIPESSVWTHAVDHDPSRGADHMHRVSHLKARLVETSVVSTPAYPSATVESVRSVALGPIAPCEWRIYLEHQRRKFAVAKSD